MKKIKLLIIGIAVILTMTGCDSSHNTKLPDIDMNTNKSKILVAYFSLSNNAPYGSDVEASSSASIVISNDKKIGTTEYIADFIVNKTGGDKYLIQVEDQYSTSFEEVRQRNHNEQDDTTYPKLVSNDLNIDDYDIIFLGYPVWATTIPMVIASFINEYDLSGKTVIPFCSHDGYGSGNSYNEIKELAMNIDLLDGIAIKSTDILTSNEQLSRWIDSLNLDLPSSTDELTININDYQLAGVLNDSYTAKQFKQILPKTISMVHYGNREYYGSIDESVDVEGEGQLRFEDGDITFCPTNNTIAIFYNQSDKPNLTMPVYVIGKVTSDLAIFDELNSSVDISFLLK